jgi:hypothetical protein
VFYRTGDNRLEVITQDAPNGVFGSPEELARNVDSDPVAALGADGRIYVFFRGSDNALWYTRNYGLQYEAYTKAASIGGEMKEQPAAALDGSGRIVVGVRGIDNGLYTTQQKSENALDFGSFAKQSSGMTDSPTTAVDAASRVQFFYRGTDQAAWRVGQTDDYQSYATGVSLGGQIQQRPIAALGWDGRLNVFVIGTDKALWVAAQTNENDDDYTTFQSLAGTIGLPTPIPDHRNLLHVFYRSTATGQALGSIAQDWA